MCKHNPECRLYMPANKARIESCGLKNKAIVRITECNYDPGAKIEKAGHHSGKINKERRSKIKALIKKGLYRNQIAKKLKLSENVVSYYVGIIKKKDGLQITKQPFKAAHKRGTIFSNKGISEETMLREAKHMTNREIADEHGVTANNVWIYLNNRGVKAVASTRKRR